MLWHGRIRLSRLSALCLYPDISPSRRASHSTFRLQGHFLLKLNGSYRIFEAIVGSLNSDMNWLPKLKVFSSRVHLVDKLGISPLFLFCLVKYLRLRGEDLEMFTKCSHFAGIALGLLLM